jgi:hypothetical protein
MRYCWRVGRPILGLKKTSISRVQNRRYTDGSEVPLEHFDSAFCRWDAVLICVITETIDNISVVRTTSWKSFVRRVHCLIDKHHPTDGLNACERSRMSTSIHSHDWCPQWHRLIMKEEITSMRAEMLVSAKWCERLQKFLFARFTPEAGFSMLTLIPPTGSSINQWQQVITSTWMASFGSNLNIRTQRNRAIFHWLQLSLVKTTHRPYEQHETA